MELITCKHLISLITNTFTCIQLIFQFTNIKQNTITMNFKKLSKRLAIFAGILALLFFGGRFLIKTMAGEDALNIISGFFQQAIGGEVPDNKISTDYFTPQETAIKLDSTILPFREIGETLGDAAKGNNFVTLRGATILDANNDGRMDLFFPHSGRQSSKQNDENGVLQMDKFTKGKPCALYLNMGNAQNGDPIYKSVSELIKTQRGNKHTKKELMFENKYIPRESVEEDEFGVGRCAWGAASGDFNGDGLVDLLILNHHYGMPFIDVSLSLKIFPPSENIGRKKSGKNYIKTTLPPYLAGDMKDGIHNTVNFSGKEEVEGRNTLLLNLGDKDGDGIPEWKDATEEAEMHTTNWSSASASIADIDRDGDLDIYICNFIDPDFWGFGLNQFGGHPNELWINQMAETGKLTFKESASSFKVAGLHDEENIPSSNWDGKSKTLVNDSDQKHNGKQIGKKADHSWASQMVDFTNDGYPDLLVANDIGNRLRVYENLKGKGFKIYEKFNKPEWNGSWMGIASGDLNGDMKDEIMATSFGSQSVTIRNTVLFADNPEDMYLTATGTLNYLEGKACQHHALLSFLPDVGFKDIVRETEVEYSPYIAPDITQKSNCAPEAEKLYEEFNYAKGFAALEFAWNPLFFDLENDGDLDIYTVGSLSRGNDDFLGEMTSSPGRLIVNESTTDKLKFKEKTLEYRVLDIVGLDYEANPPRRKAPGTNWHKRDYVYLQDMDSYAEMGLEASQKSRIKDIFRMHECANGSIAADLNNDGFDDMVVCHAGGNNSNLPSARNLKVNIMGKVMAMPPPNKVIKAPTNFEEGPTFVYINGGAPKGKTGNWVKIVLKDPTTANVHGVGAKVIVNDKIMRRFLVGGQSFSAVHAPLNIGLGEESLKKLEIHWPSGDIEPQIVEFKKPITNEVVEVKRS